MSQHSSSDSVALTPVRLQEIGQIALSVSDVSRSRAFYERTLGMQFLFEGGTMAFFQCGTVRLVVGMSEKSGTTDKAGGSGTIVYFRVHDIAVTHQALAARKVTFVAAPHMVAKFPDHELWLAFFIDPDENVLALMSEVRPAKAD